MKPLLKDESLKPTQEMLDLVWLWSFTMVFLVCVSCFLSVSWWFAGVLQVFFRDVFGPMCCCCCCCFTVVFWDCIFPDVSLFCLCFLFGVVLYIVFLWCLF